MPRQREFVPEEALQKVITLFWEKGYNGTSVDEVVKRTGVAKYGIYGTFGTKRELFKKALSQFAIDRHNDIQRPLRKANASLPHIRAFFKSAPKTMTQTGRQHGCLMCNTGVEVGLNDPEFNKIVQSFFAETTNVMKHCLERAVDKGELDHSTDAGSLATYLVTEFRTSLMLARSGHSRREIENHLKIALRILG
ncbi:MAG: TetR/AcrR family transcriptional regulator [Rhodospirillales bacterium]|nr:TetR/AcrR family transcriptional regulator [Rhodospirillales bacterium]